MPGKNARKLVDVSATSQESLPVEAQVRAADLESVSPDASLDPEDLPPAGSTREDRIREAAYAAYERRGGTPGSAEEDWLEAERKIDGRT